MICISINYKKADADIRGKFAFDEAAQDSIWKILREKNSDECVILCTCSRTEIYAEGNIAAGVILSVMSDLTQASDIKQYAMVFEGISAVNHLFKVCCGMDSMVLGEDEILGQTRMAYMSACEKGMTGHRLNMIFQAALACAKKIKTDTSLSGVPVSTATLAANEAVSMGSNILIVGASGKIGNSTLKNILSHRDTIVTVTARKHIPDINEMFRDRVNIIPYDRRYEYINDADCIISATSSPVYTFTYEKVRSGIIDEKNRLFIDLAVPKDIDESIAELKGCRLLNIDHFENMAENNSMIKLSAKDKAEAIITEDIGMLRKNMTMQKFLSCSEEIRQHISEKGIFRLKAELDADSFEKVIKALSDNGKE